MRKSRSFIAGLCIALSSASLVRAAGNVVPASAFVESLTRDVALGSTCRDEYDPRAAVLQHPMQRGSMRKWEEPDRREPDTINHMIEWSFPGFVLKTTTHFSWSGPSTWLHSLRISSPFELPAPLSFGQKIADVLDSLEVLDQTNGPVQLSHDSAYVNLEFNEDGELQEVFLECLAD